MVVRTSTVVRGQDREQGSLPIGIPPSKVWAPLSSASFFDASVLEAALTWIVHQRVLSTIRRHQSLDRQIVDFCRTVFDAIGSSGRLDIQPDHLWMIYFKIAYCGDPSSKGDGRCDQRGQAANRHGGGYAHLKRQDR